MVAVVFRHPTEITSRRHPIDPSRALRRSVQVGPVTAHIEPTMLGALNLTRGGAVVDRAARAVTAPRTRVSPAQCDLEAGLNRVAV